MLLVREVALFQSASGLQQLVYFKCNLSYRMVFSAMVLKHLSILRGLLYIPLG